MTAKETVPQTTDGGDPGEARSRQNNWDVVASRLDDGLPLPCEINLNWGGRGRLCLSFDRLTDAQPWIESFGLELAGKPNVGNVTGKTIYNYVGSLGFGRVTIWVHADPPATEQPDATLTAVEDDAAKQPDPHANDHAGCTPETCEEVQAQWLIAVREAHEEGNHNDCDPDDCEFGMRGFGAASANGAYERGLATRDGAQVYDASVEDEPHEHGCYERPGLGVLPDDENCEGCCSVATAAVRGAPPAAAVALALLSPDEPITDADRISAAIDAKAAEAAGEDGLTATTGGTPS